MSTLPSDCARNDFAPCRAQAANENPDTSSNDLFVEHVDIALHRWVHAGWVKVVRQLNRNQKLRRVFSNEGLRTSSTALRAGSFTL
jgi:hypothetical protein